MLCEQRMHEFMKSRGIAIWDYRMLETEPVEESVRYEVLKAAGARCSLCGRTKDDDVLEVDHIVPRSKGGSNDIENLQVLCRTCNRGKSNRDDTDFR